MDWLSNPAATVLLDAIAVLDRLPAYLRAMLTGLLLAASLRFFEVRIAGNEISYGEAFRKATLVVLLLVPFAMAAFPDGRLAVLVAALPEGSSTGQPVWLAVLGIWARGCLICLTRPRERKTFPSALITTLKSIRTARRPPTRNGAAC